MSIDKKVDKPSEADFYKNIVANLPDAEKSSNLWVGFSTIIKSKAKKRGRR
jgi:hypothetical protein